MNAKLQVFFLSFFLNVFFHSCLPAVNYRGSTGFGQDSIQSLIGNVGSQDVKDVQVPADCLWLRTVHFNLRQNTFISVIFWWKPMFIMTRSSCLPTASCSHCTAERWDPWLWADRCDWGFSWWFPVLSFGWSVPGLLQSVCSQEPSH